MGSWPLQPQITFAPSKNYLGGKIIFRIITIEKTDSPSASSEKICLILVATLPTT